MRSISAGLMAAVISAVAISFLQTAEAGGTIGSFTYSHDSWQELLTAPGLVQLARDFWAWIGPGGKLHPQYFLEHKGHLVLEGLFLVLILYLLTQKRQKPGPRNAPLTDKEIDSLCAEWEPEPLAPNLPAEKLLKESYIITSMDGPYVVVDGKRVLNLASTDYLSLTTNAQLKASSKATIEKYGVGSCGPRGFYGTIDVHLHLEEALAKFMQHDAAIIYSFDIATVSSVIPAFLNRNDVLVIDELCSYPIQSGATVSRAKVYTFKHNDMADLERVFQKLEAEERKQKGKPLARKFIAVEGIYANYGDIVPLDQLVPIKEKYKYRLIVEESHSVGVLGATGRGVCEHYGIDPRKVELLCGSMGCAFASVGGWCVGELALVEHQRLSGSGYCFSASLPPYLASAAIDAVKRIETPDGQAAMIKLAAVAAALRQGLSSVPGLKLYGGSAFAPSPLLHLQLAAPSGDEDQDQATCARIVEHMRVHAGILAAASRYSVLDARRPPPSIRVHASAVLSDKQVAQVLEAVRKAAAAILS